MSASGKRRWAPAHPLAAVIVALLVVLLGLDLWGGLRRLQASRLLRQVEELTLAVAAQRVSANHLQKNLENLERAAELDPLLVGVPLAQGGQYLLLGRTGEAVEAYHRALDLEPRPEIYLNLGRAHMQAGREVPGRQAVKKAVTLDWHLQKEIPRFWLRDEGVAPGANRREPGTRRPQAPNRGG